MEAYWNKLSLDRPPTTSWQCLSHQFDSQGFLKAINRAILELESQKLLQIEAALLSRLIYRMKSKLRSDKGLKNMEKVNRGLLNYLKLSLESDYKYIKDNTECEGDTLALPSRQMLQYALVRTQGFAKLMCRIEVVAKRAADFFKARISLGQAWNVSVVAYAVVSRIWLLCRYLAKKCCDWYSRMYKYLNELTAVGVSWLPENYLLPHDLKMWLSVPWIDEEIKSISKKENLGDSIFNLITRNDETEENLRMDLDEKNDSPPAKSLLVAKKEETQMQMEIPAPPSMEIGERISREAFAADLAKQTTQIPETKKRKNVPVKEDEVIGSPSKQKPIIAEKLTDKKKKKKSKLLSVNNLETTKDVVEFLSRESYPGLDRMQWKIVKKNVKKLLLKLNKSEGISAAQKKEIILKKVIQALRKWIH